MVPVLAFAQDDIHVSKAVPPPTQEHNRALRDIAWPTAIGFLLRVSIGVCVYHNFLDPARDHWEFGYEIGHIARSMATGHGFASPYWTNTGPTAILTPVYPGILAIIFTAFGVFTRASALAVLLLNCCFSALTAAPVFLIARRVFNAKTAKLASLVWTFFPYSIYFSVGILWYHAFAGLLVALIFLAALLIQDRDDRKTWFGFGVLFGLAVLTNPVIAGIAPPVGIWLMRRLARHGRRWLKAGFAGVFAMVLTVLPWLARNSLVLHQLVPFKDGFWMEVCVGNLNNTLHWWDAGEHPSGGDEANKQFERLGEVNYMAAERRKALAYIQAHPVQYAWRSLRHAVFLWTGFWSLNRDYLRMEPFDPENIVLASTLSVFALMGLLRLLRHDTLGSGLLFVLVLLFYPLPYYLSHADPGFRHPIDPLLVVLACSTIVRPLPKQVNKPDQEIEFAFR